VESNVSRDPEIKSVSLKVMLDSNGILKDAHLAGPDGVRSSNSFRPGMLPSWGEGQGGGRRPGRLQHPGQGRRLQAFLLRPPCRSCGYGLPARPPALVVPVAWAATTRSPASILFVGRVGAAGSCGGRPAREGGAAPAPAARSIRRRGEEVGRLAVYVYPTETDLI
jgi:hypothetical protein